MAKELSIPISSGVMDKWDEIEVLTPHAVRSQVAELPPTTNARSKIMVQIVPRDEKSSFKHTSFRAELDYAYCFPGLVP